jgi:L-asparagine transporter-like permease
MRSTHIPAAAGVINFVILVAALSSMNSILYVVHAHDVQPVARRTRRRGASVC